VRGTRARQWGALRWTTKTGTCLKSKSLTVARIGASFAEMPGNKNRQELSFLPAQIRKTNRVAACLGELPAQQPKTREGSAEKHDSRATIGNALGCARRLPRE
jgi:hypothetical protein